MLLAENRENRTIAKKHYYYYYIVLQSWKKNEKKNKWFFSKKKQSTALIKKKSREPGKKIFKISTKPPQNILLDVIYLRQKKTMIFKEQQKNLQSE